MRPSVPLRYGIWLICLVTVLMVFLQVRIEVHELRKDLGRTRTAIREARVLNQRLSLEMDNRRRLVEAERIAVDLGLDDQVSIVEASRRHVDR